jgi:hypothetical protein
MQISDESIAKFAQFDLDCNHATRRNPSEPFQVLQRSESPMLKDYITDRSKQQWKEFHLVWPARRNPDKRFPLIFFSEW